MLRGGDNVDNADFAGNLLDKNDGTLKGYKAYVNLQQQLDAGITLDVHGAFLPGDAAALLLNGNIDSRDMATEAKHALQWAF